MRLGYDAERWLRSIELSEKLFRPLPDRLSVLTSQSSGWQKKNRVVVNIWRNHAIEPVLNLAEKYLDFFGVDPEWVIGAYDDTFTTVPHPADYDLFWVDFSRYDDHQEISERLVTQIHTLISWGHSRVIVLADQIPARLETGLLAIDRSLCTVECISFRKEFGDQVETANPRLTSFAGSSVTGQCQVLIARHLAGKCLRDLSQPQVKAVIFDLDQTLYSGVLGEDGPENLVVGPHHKRLHGLVRSLRASGVLLGLLSKNDPADVRKLLDQSSSFGLSRSDFDCIEVGWEGKPVGMARILEEFRIAADAAVFVDDNIGELSAVWSQFPSIQVIWAKHPGSVYQQLQYLPGLNGGTLTKEDSLRSEDLRAIRERQAIIEDFESPTDFFSSLQTRIKVSVASPDDIPRLAQLSSKTNQFNLTFSRFVEEQLRVKALEESFLYVSVSLADRLSDSGIVAFLAAEKHKDFVKITELAISCRALGRGLESAMIFESLKMVSSRWPAVPILLWEERGPRNQPALDWLANFSGWDFSKKFDAWVVNFSDYQIPKGISVDSGNG